jgi:hypothetical protein
MRTESIKAWLESQPHTHTLASSLARDLIASRDTLRRLRIFGHQIKEQGDLMLTAEDFAGAMLELIPDEEP